eukprot:SM000030S11430  [mRNA]  locus=s30:604860:611122:+ [translate_table: standard]
MPSRRRAGLLGRPCRDGGSAAPRSPVPRCCSASLSLQTATPLLRCWLRPADCEVVSWVLRACQQASPANGLRRSTRKRRRPRRRYESNDDEFLEDEDDEEEQATKTAQAAVAVEENDDDDDVDSVGHSKEEREDNEVEPGQNLPNGSAVLVPREGEDGAHLAEDGKDEEAMATSSQEEKVAAVELVPPVLPRREGLRPRRQDGLMKENGSQYAGEAKRRRASDEEGDDEGEGEEEDEEDEEEEEEEEEGEEGREGPRRYALRNRTEVQRFSPRREQRPPRQQSPRKLYHHKRGSREERGERGGRRRDGGRSHKRHRDLRDDDSDESLLLDDIGQGSVWGRAGRSSDPPWLPAGFDSPWWGGGGEVAPTGGHSELVAAGGASLVKGKGGADIQPVQVDASASFDQVGGLAAHIDALKEMVFFPLLYPSFFASYKITPPRGVLLCGPPGTGKTLVARALAGAASRAGRKVTFFMRKGADVLSKWVGEAERQLRLLFEEAARCQPSIIFFDEIDGLAPVRSSRQEQIHNSIVSTLLALMDGLDARGQVVVIGATNRVDAIDGALRRPGRFDREFFFPLPNAKAREDILAIHTRNWQNPPASALRKELAASCVGYCGADVKALCTEAAIRAFRRRYPQVYQNDEQYVIDVDSVKVERRHFLEAMSAITPAAHRSVTVYARPLPPLLSALLKGHQDAAMSCLKDSFTPLMELEKEEGVNDDDGEDDDEDPAYIASVLSSKMQPSFIYTPRPRLLLCGERGAGQEHLGPALLHELERYPVYSLGLPSLLADPGAKSPEEALVHIVGEARKNVPAILFLPHLPLWWDTAHDQLRATLVMLLADLPAWLPILLLGTAEGGPNDIDPEACSIFGRHLYILTPPTMKERLQFFAPLVDAIATSPKLEKHMKKPLAALEPLPKVPVAEVGPSEAELKAKAELEGHAMRRLRMCLRDVCNRLLYEKRFAAFHYPLLDDEEEPGRSDRQGGDAGPVVGMDVISLLQKVDNGSYWSRSSFLQDVELILTNAKLYYGEDYQGAKFVSKACALRDAVYSMLSQMDPTLVAFCDEIASRGGPFLYPEQSKEDGKEASILGQKDGRGAARPARASARLRGVQAQVNLHQALEQVTRKSAKRVGDHAQRCPPFSIARHGREGAEDKQEATGSGRTPATGDNCKDSAVSAAPMSAEGAATEGLRKDPSNGPADIAGVGVQAAAGQDQPAGQDYRGAGSCDVAEAEAEAIGGQVESREETMAAELLEDPSTAEKAAEERARLEQEHRARGVTWASAMARRTAHSSVDQLLALHAAACRVLYMHRKTVDRSRVLDALEALALDDSLFQASAGGPDDG